MAAFKGEDVITALCFREHHGPLEGEPGIVEQFARHGRRADHGTGEDDQNRGMHHIDAETAPGPFLGKEQESALLVIGFSGFPPLVRQQGSDSGRGLCRRKGEADGPAERLFFQLGAGGGKTIPADDPKNLGNTFQAANDQIKRKQGQQREKPPGVIHIRDVQYLQKPGGFRPVLLDIKRLNIVLGDDGAYD